MAIEKLENPVRLIDENGIIVYMNEIMKSTFGDLVGQTADFIFQQSGGEENPASSEITSEPDPNAPHYREVVIADVIYSIRSVSVGTGAGKFFRLEMLEDISEKKHLQEQRIRTLRMLKKDTGIAKNIQEGILPKDGKYWGMIDLSALYLPAYDVGGDVFDIIRLKEDECLFYIGDVSGHGIQASLLTMFISEKIRSEAGLAGMGLDLLITKLLDDFIALDLDASIYFTLLICRCKKSTGELVFANAGHNCMPLIIRRDGRSEEVRMKGMPLTKISDPDSYTEEVIHYKSGDRLIFYTDGLIEEYSKIERKTFGSNGLRRTAEFHYPLKGKAYAEKILEESERYLLINARDDRTIVIAELL